MYGASRHGRPPDPPAGRRAVVSAPAAKLIEALHAQRDGAARSAPKDTEREAPRTERTRTEETQ
eukprot:COSAG03_NODE_15197_length_438_cov_0.914454_1_plen_63_part_01